MARILVFSNVGCHGCHGRTDGEMIHGVTSSETFFLFYLADPYDMYICMYIYIYLWVYIYMGNAGLPMENDLGMVVFHV